MKKNSTLLCASLLAFGLLTGVAHASSTTFSQYFNNGTGSSGDKTLAVYNWNAAAGTSGTVHTGGVVTNFAVSQGLTNNLGVPTVSGASTNAGFAFALPANTTSEATILYNTNLTSTTSFQDAPQGSWFRSGGTQTLSGLTLGEIGSVSFYARNGSTSPVMRLAIQVGGTWYASNTSFQTTQTANFEKFTLTSPVGINWYEDAFAPGTSLSADVTGLSSVSLTSGSVVTGYGVYSDIGGLSAANARVRIDSFEVITAIPEPSSIAALFGTVALGFVATRRRRGAR